MLQIIDEMPKRPKFMDQLLGGVQKAGQQLPGLLGNMAEDQKIEQLTGQNVSGLSPEMKQLFFQNIMKGQGQNQAKQGAYQKAQGLINRAKQISQTGHLGPKVGILGTGRDFGSTFSSEGQKLRSEYKQIGKALVQAAAPLKITNRAEFQHYAEDLEDPTRNLEDIQGSLEALERIIRDSMQMEQLDSSVGSPVSQQKRPSLSSFMR
jgi:hypothetical protein